MTHPKQQKIMNGDITLDALRRYQRASKVMSPFIIFLLFWMCHFAVISCR